MCWETLLTDMWRMEQTRFDFFQNKPLTGATQGNHMAPIDPWSSRQWLVVEDCNGLICISLE